MINGRRCGWAQPWVPVVAKVIPHAQYSTVAGTAFVVSIQGDVAYLMTLAHVLAGDAKPSVEFLADPKRAYEAAVYRMHGSDKKDMAILQVMNPPKAIRVARPHDRTLTTEGTDVKIAGYPAALSGNFTVKSGTATVQGLDLVISPRTESGYSGGPVILNDGVAGMVYDHIQDYGRALSAETVAAYLRNNKVTWGATNAVVARFDMWQDLKRTSRNEVKLSNDFVAVVIYGGEEIDVTEIDVASVRLSDGAGSGVPSAMYHLEKGYDENNDGRDDLKLDFQLAALRSSGNLSGMSSTFRVTGYLKGTKQPFRGGNG